MVMFWSLQWINPVLQEISCLFTEKTDQIDMEVDRLKARSGVKLHVRYGLVPRNRMRERGADAGVSGGLSGCWFVESQYSFHCRGYSIVIRRAAV